MTQLGTLVLVEHKGGRIEAPTLNTMVAAKALGHDITALVAGDDVQKVAESAAQTLGAQKVGSVQHECMRFMWACHAVHMYISRRRICACMPCTSLGATVPAPALAPW